MPNKVKNGNPCYAGTRRLYEINLRLYNTI